MPARRVKGFAVVANEVKELANQTAKATGEIGGQVEAVQRTAGEAEESMSVINETIREIHETAAGIAESVGQQQIATSEIARSIEMVASSAHRVGESVGVVSGSADLGRNSASDVKSGADEVSGEASVLSQEVETFLSALGNQDDEDTFRIYTVDLAAEVIIDGVSHSARVKKISTAAAHIDIRLNASAGSRLQIRIETFPDEISCRVAGSDGEGTQIQFPLNLEHIAQMRDVLELNQARKAA